MSGLSSRARAALAANVTLPPAPRPRWLRRGRLDLVVLADAMAAVICFAATAAELGGANASHGSPYPSPVLVLLSAALSLPLLLRTRWPLAAWSVSALAMIWAGAMIPPGRLSTAPFLAAGIIVYLLCLYAVAVRCQTWVLIGASAVTVVGAAFIRPGTTVVAILLAVLPVFAGVIMRSRRRNLQRLEVAERRHEGERALLEERQRIARELHDVVAHHMSVIAIQAEAAPYKIADPPPELAESFADIRASALTGLKELRRVLGVLRSDQPDTTPQPGLGDLDGLAESARGGGLTVTTAVTGTPRPLPQGVDLSAYRIVQEALSNAIRHAPGAAVQVRLYYSDSALVIKVRNDRCGPGGQAGREQPDGAGLGGSGGHGIVGMRERAAMLGGYLEAGPAAGGGFLVTAALPLSEAEGGR